MYVCMYVSIVYFILKELRLLLTGDWRVTNAQKTTFEYTHSQSGVDTQLCLMFVVGFEVLIRASPVQPSANDRKGLIC